MTSQPNTPPTSGERLFVSACCILAAVQTFIFSAAFPLFNNADEPAHYDLVFRYAQGDPPRSFGLMDTNWVAYDAFYGTPEYFNAPTFFPDGRIPPPLWAQSFESIATAFAERKAAWQGTNHESSQPPLYYSLAGLWWRLGQGIGLVGGNLLYWIRFLNVLLVVALVWTGYRVAREVFGDHPVARLGLPALLACFPHTVFYSVNNDVLMPLGFGLAFLCLIRWLRADTPGPAPGFALGLALAAVYLTKLSSLPFLAVSAGFVLGHTVKAHHPSRWRQCLPGYAAMIFSAGLPVVAWALWCQVHFGDLMGSAGKVQLLGWTHLPVSRWLDHPVFQVEGLWTFISGVCATFWRGEMLWHGRPLAIGALDACFIGLTLFGLAVAGWRLVRPLGRNGDLRRRAVGLAWCLFVAGVLFLLLLSIAYDFGEKSSPTRQHPYFTTGRLILGALIPFLVLLLDAILTLTSHLKPRRTAMFVISALCLFCLAGGWVINRPVFKSDYNWFKVRHESRQAVTQAGLVR